VAEALADQMRGGADQMRGGVEQGGQVVQGRRDPGDLGADLEL